MFSGNWSIGLHHAIHCNGFLVTKSLFLLDVTPSADCSEYFAYQSAMHHDQNVCHNILTMSMPLNIIDSSILKRSVTWRVTWTSHSCQEHSQSLARISYNSSKRLASKRENYITRWPWNYARAKAFLPVMWPIYHTGNFSLLLAKVGKLSIPKLKSIEELHIWNSRW